MTERKRSERGASADSASARGPDAPGNPGGSGSSENPAGSGGSKNPNRAPGDPAPGGANPLGANPNPASKRGNPGPMPGGGQFSVHRYLLAAVPQQLLPPGLAPIDSRNLSEMLERDPDIQVIRPLKPPAALRGPAEGTQYPEIIVVEMSAAKAASLAHVPQLHVEPDLPLTYTRPGPLAELDAPLRDPGVIVPYTEPISLTFEVRGTDNEPVPDATVFVAGANWPVQGATGPDGRVTLSLVGDTPASVRGLYIKPKRDHWSLWISRPKLTTDQDNVFRLRSLSESFPGFPDRQIIGWGMRAMHLDRLPPTYRGHGVKIAIIDSGAATEHPDLEGHIANGIDLVDVGDRTWTVDRVGHGSHCAGVITGADNGIGILGIAVEAEVHVCKIFPGGRLSDLIEALDYCIAQEIDVINLSLGSEQPSVLVSRKIEEARNAGVACVVAAGNSGGPVVFPGSLPTVLTVAAIGKLDEYPADSYHATQVASMPTPEGYFSPRFTNHGPEVDVCAPGVAIVSCVPPRNYAAWDGTSMATPHVAGLAALILAHHPDFRDRFAARGPARVSRLFDIIKASCEPLNVGDPTRTGAGLPNALRALGLEVSAVWPAVSPSVTLLLEGLRAEMARAGLLPYGQEMPITMMAAPTPQATGAAYPWPTEWGQFPTSPGGPSGLHR